MNLGILKTILCGPELLVPPGGGRGAHWHGGTVATPIQETAPEPHPLVVEVAAGRVRGPLLHVAEGRGRSSLLGPLEGGGLAPVGVGAHVDRPVELLALERGQLCWLKRPGPPGSWASAETAGHASEQPV